jgi:succinyl-diaminopimelate desuccinylase
MLEDIIAELDKDYTIKILEEMIKTPSVVGEESTLAHYLREELEALGFKTILHVIEKDRTNIYARLQGEKPGKRLNFNGHMDTIPPVKGWDFDPFTPEIEGNRIYGLGACDMKGGIACILNMLRAWVNSEHEFRGELSFSGVIDEEALGIGAKAMLETDYRSLDAIVIGEPYPGNIGKPVPLGITGKILYDIQVKGKAAHGFQPDLGVNAIEEAARIITNLNKLEFKENEAFGTGNNTTLKIEGGYKKYSVVIPASCRFEVNRTIVPGETVEYAISDMHRLIESIELDAEVEVKIKPPRYEAFIMDPENPLFKLLNKVYSRVTGKKPIYNYSNGITDANTFTGIGGIPTLHLGPTGGGVHQKNEYLDLEWLKPVSEIYTGIAAEYLI